MACCDPYRSAIAIRIAESCVILHYCAMAAVGGNADSSALLRGSLSEPRRDHCDTRVDRLKACVPLSFCRVPVELPAIFWFPQCGSKRLRETEGNLWQISDLTLTKSIFLVFSSRICFSSWR